MCSISFDNSAKLVQTTRYTLKGRLMNKFVVGSLIAVQICTNITICSEKQQTLTPYQAAGIGVIAGVGEVFIDQPLITIKNILQQNKNNSVRHMVKNLFFDEKNKFSIAKWYRGSCINAASMAFITPLQMGGQALVAEKIGDQTHTQKIFSAYIAGACASIAATPAEYIMIQQQIMSQSVSKTVAHLYAQKNIHLFKGFIPTALRDGGFTVGYLTLGDMIKETCNIHNAVIANSIAGVCAAVITHPFDTIKTIMQTHNTSLTQTCAHIYSTGGATGFFKGLVPRGLRVILAINVMNTIKESCKEYIANKTKE